MRPFTKTAAQQRPPLFCQFDRRIGVEGVELQSAMARGHLDERIAFVSTQFRLGAADAGALGRFGHRLAGLGGGLGHVPIAHRLAHSSPRRPGTDQQSGQRIARIAAADMGPPAPHRTALITLDDRAQLGFAMHAEAEQILGSAGQHQNCARPAIKARDRGVERAVAGENRQTLDPRRIEFDCGWEILVRKTDGACDRQSGGTAVALQFVERSVAVAAALGVGQQPECLGKGHDGIALVWTIRFPGGVHAPAPPSPVKFSLSE